MVLVILAVLWAAVLVPPLLRARTERGSDSIGDFNFRLGVLGATNGALPAHRLRRTIGSAAKRRRDVLRALVIAVGVTALLVSVTSSPVAWVLQVFADVMLAAFLGLWAWVRAAQVERTAKVRTLFPRREPEPQLALRRTGSS